MFLQHDLWAPTTSYIFTSYLFTYLLAYILAHVCQFILSESSKNQEKGVTPPPAGDVGDSQPPITPFTYHPPQHSFAAPESHQNTFGMTKAPTLTGQHTLSAVSTASAFSAQPNNQRQVNHQDAMFKTCYIILVFHCKSFHFSICTLSTCHVTCRRTASPQVHRY